MAQVRPLLALLAVLALAFAAMKWAMLWRKLNAAADAARAEAQRRAAAADEKNRSNIDDSATKG